MYKEPSSVMQYQQEFILDTLPITIVPTLYSYIPFAVELRCILDFTFSTTALDVF